MTGMRPPEPTDAELQIQIAELTSELRGARTALLASERTWIAAFDTDRENLGRLLHDTLAQSLTAAKIYARLVRSALPHAPLRPEDAATLNVAALEELLEKAGRECHELARWVRPAQADGSNLVSCMADLARLASQTIPCAFFCSETETNADPQVQVNLLRITQLALHELVRRPARADKTLELHLSCDEQCLIAELRVSVGELSIEIVKMLEARARSTLGTLRVEQLPPAGSALVCVLPNRATAGARPSSTSNEPVAPG